METWRAFMFRRRSSGSLGRIEMRSSSELSQLKMFRNRSRLPLKRRNEFEHQLDEPMTTKRPLASPAPLYVPAAPSTSGPFLSFADCLISPEDRFTVAKLFSVVEKSFSTVVLSVLFTSSDLAMGKPVGVSFIVLVMACDSYDVTS